MLWLVAVIGAAASWGVSEIFSDVCVLQHEDEEESNDDNPARYHPHHHHDKTLDDLLMVVEGGDDNSNANGNITNTNTNTSIISPSSSPPTISQHSAHHHIKGSATTTNNNTTTTTTTTSSSIIGSSNHHKISSIPPTTNTTTNTTNTNSSSSNSSHTHNTATTINISAAAAAASKSPIPTGTRPNTPDSKKRRQEALSSGFPLLSDDASKMLLQKKGEDRHLARLVESGKLSGEQSTFVSGLTMLLCTVLLHSFSHTGPMSSFTAAWWISILAGIFNACAYFFLFKAYETAPSTVIVPLVQLTAVMMLFTSSFTSFLAPLFPTILASQEESFLTVRECMAYSIILLGGLMPAAHGNLSLFRSSEFWRQPYVMYILFNDALLAVYYELMDIVTSETLDSTPEQFMIVSCYAASFTFISMFIVFPKLRPHVRSLGNVRSKYLLYCIASEILNWAAYWMATYAYHSHQANINIVGAAEVALSQVMNLAMATAMMYGMGLGRSSAVEGLGVKCLSCVCICIGIMLTITIKHTTMRPPKSSGSVPPGGGGGGGGGVGGGGGGGGVRHNARLLAVNDGLIIASPTTLSQNMSIITNITSTTRLQKKLKHPS